MATINLYQLTVKTPDQVRDDYLRAVRYGLIQRGVADPNVTKNSDLYVRATALANEISVALSNSVTIGEQAMPDTSTTNLVRQAGLYGLAIRAAQGAVGSVVHASSSPSLVPVGTQLIDAGGQRFQVTSGGVYANGALIPIAGIDAGAITNHVLGDVMQWVSPPPFAAAKVLVAIGGLTGGIDADSQQVLRARLLDRLKHPPTGGNWAQVTQWAEASNAAVQKCFVYPALDGPATQGVCLLGYLSFDPVLKFSRGIPASVTQQIASYVVAQAPQHANTTFTSPTSRPLPNPNLQTDVSISMTLPASLTASPPGPGGGWVDATPWPKLYGGNLYAAVLIVTSPTQFQIVGFLGAAGTTPKFAELLPGVTRIAWFNKASYAAGGPAVVVSTVISATGSDGNVVVTIDPQAPFNGIAPGDMICPASERVEVYAQTMLASFQSLGPGQWTTDTNRLPRASRYPLTSQAWPSDLTAAQLKDMSNSGSEVLDVAYLYRTQSSPGVPADTTKCPNVLVPGNFGIYPM